MNFSLACHGDMGSANQYSTQDTIQARVQQKSHTTDSAILAHFGRGETSRSTAQAASGMREGGATAAQAVGTELLNSDVPIASSAWLQPR